MALSPGTRIGPYEIIAPLGAGGMGEVYRARDNRLGRELAVKILPAEFSNKGDRLIRFEQEARSASALNHPNIITVYEIGSQDGISFIAMEFVDGKTLRELLLAGPIPLKRTISIAAQLADGLAKAHAAGIVHRDVKPENLIISQDGFVKILDFGLAKPLDLRATAGSMVPTTAHTDAGIILGTVGYMSPEQASGKSVDFRSDQFSLGCILYEMIAGKAAFARTTPVQSLSAIIQEEPEPLEASNPQTPAPIRWIVERCLAKDPEERYASTRDLARELQKVRDHFSDLRNTSELSASAIAVETIPVHRKWKWQIVLPWILLTLLGTLLVVQVLQPKPQTKAAPRSVEISIPRGHQLSPNAQVVLAPDGSAVVFGTVGPPLGSQLWLRRFDRFDTISLPGTQGATHPFWSPDSKSIGFFVDSEQTLRRLDLASGRFQIICKLVPSGMRAAGFARGGSWGTDGTILFAPNSNSPIQRVPATGGEPVNVTKLDPSILDGSHRFPVFLPDGEHFLFTLWSNHAETAARVGGIYLGSLQRGIVRKLTSDCSQAVLAGNHQFLTYRNDSLVALPFDPVKLEMTGEEKEIVSHPFFYRPSGSLSTTVSVKGDLAYALSAGEGRGQLYWLDRSGTPGSSLFHQRIALRRLVLSLDGTRFAAQVEEQGGQIIWIGDTKREILTRLSRGGLDTVNSVWSPDGSNIAFASRLEGSASVFIQPADGTTDAKVLIADKKRDFLPTSWSSDGKYLFVDSNVKDSNHSEIWLYDFSETKLRPIVSDPAASITSGTLSPDGRWLAYVSDGSGNQEVFIRCFPALDRKWQISNLGGTAPHWRNDGREVLFVASDQSFQSVKIEPKDDDLEATSPVQLFVPKVPLLAIAPSPDHNRFLAAIIPADVRSEPVHLILNWESSGSQKSEH